MELKLICHICREQIGRFDPDDIKLPLVGHMFKAIDDIHGYPPPFDAKATWNYFHCLRDNNPDKTARHRPFPAPDTILTDKGLYKVGDRIPGPVTYEVPVYDQEDLAKEWDERSNPDGKRIVLPLNYAKPKSKPKAKKGSKPKAKAKK